MPDPVKSRRYDSPLRREAAARTRRAVLDAAHDLFTTRGWHGTAVAEVARRAGVSLDTVYSSVGRKPALLTAVVDMELAGGPEPLPAEQRDYVRRIRSATGGRARIEVYAAALVETMPRVAPLLLALRAAGDDDPECARAAAAVSDRRAANMRLFAADLRATGDLRPDLDDEAVALLVWSMNGPEYWMLLRGRGLAPAACGRLLVDVWSRALLVDPG
ncbi:TetR/AcrR family transcriptional regulator [Nocardioides aestuarii]|uniref:TetR/AcrR family transcriptional regulator n=1 Tax=Nocardioides aestuarii TaxID=252231 RepID=A0ABW4TKP3_9ACTN